jgi:pimeloyl-ACP methyl ester carboxylesterase
MIGRWALIGLAMLAVTGRPGRAGEAEPASRPAAATPAAERPSPPAQPEKGFGGAEYAHASLRVETLGAGDAQVRVFMPAEPVPASPAPLVVFLHGWAAMEPHPYGAWIRHLVRRGSVVLYPRYQAGLGTMQWSFTPGMVAGVRAGLERLGKDDAVRVDRARVAVVGHSMGAVLSVQYAAVAATEGLPAAKAVFCIEPGSAEQWNPRMAFPLADPSAIPKETLVLVAAGDRDTFVGEAMAKKIWGQLGHIPAANKDYVLFRSDDRGRPALVADHFFPLAPDASILSPAAGSGESKPSGRPMNAARAGIDALDHRGAWRLFDALMHAAFTGEGREQCLGGTAAQKDLGAWSDGTPVKALAVTDEPGGGVER